MQNDETCWDAIEMDSDKPKTSYYLDRNEKGERKKKEEEWLFGIPGVGGTGDATKAAP